MVAIRCKSGVNSQGVAIFDSLAVQYHAPMRSGGLAAEEHLAARRHDVSKLLGAWAQSRVLNQGVGRPLAMQVELSYCDRFPIVRLNHPESSIYGGTRIHNKAS